MSVHTPFVRQTPVLPDSSTSSSTGSRDRRPNVRHYVHHLPRNGHGAIPFRPENMTVTDENGRIRPEHRYWLHEADESPVMPAGHILPRNPTVPPVWPSPTGSPIPEPFIPPPPVVQGPNPPAGFWPPPPPPPPPPPSAWLPHNTPIGPPPPPNAWMAPGMPTAARPPPPNAWFPSAMHHTPGGPPPPNAWVPGAMPGGAMPTIYPNSPFIPGVTVQGMMPDASLILPGTVPMHGAMPPVMPGINAAGPSMMPHNNDQYYAQSICSPGVSSLPHLLPAPKPSGYIGPPEFPQSAMGHCLSPARDCAVVSRSSGNYQPEIMTALMSTDAFQPRSHAVVRFTSENEVLRYWMAPERWGPIMVGGTRAFVTVGHVLDAMYEYFHRPLTPREVEIVYLQPVNRQRLEEARYWRLRELEGARRSGDYMRPGYLPEREGERGFLRSDVMGGHRRFYGCRHVLHDGVVMCSVEFIPGPIPQNLWLSTMYLV
ncbi:hypothetical protein BDZ89DRAFT_1068546 [Hymenopellis radicata]|nr:hypothetical protein BDZ89DRAFT_1068546 [Hymenopellis radicata]